MKQLVQFGAGNIGRSFVGQLFSRAGYAVTFIDVNQTVIDTLNQEGTYNVLIKDKNPETITVNNVRGILASDTEAVVQAIADCDLMATAVGKGALKHIIPPIAQGLSRRSPDNPLDIIIAENIINGAEFFRQALKPLLPEDYAIDQRVGLIETSIGKMVPIMSDADTAHDPVQVFAEAYNTLILDRTGFKSPLPEVEGLYPVDNIKAYVDRKLFIHNLGHASCAYFTHLLQPEAECIWQGLENPLIMDLTRQAMAEARDALLTGFPGVFTMDDLNRHIDDLLDRFQNRHLGDSVYRVGRDLYRKLGRHDRLIGALLFAQKHNIACPTVELAAAAAFHFKGCDPHSNMFDRDQEFHDTGENSNKPEFIAQITGLNNSVPAEAALMDKIQKHCDALKQSGSRYLQTYKENLHG